MTDESYMRMALELAAKGAGSVSPNPMVGCVLVKNQKIIGKGYHKKYGSHHAEVNAIKSAKSSVAGAVMYVTLEPCHHTGNTPPCVDAVIAAKIKRVVIALKDPDARTAGKSIRKLKKAGIEVTTGVCEAEARDLNKFFIKSQSSKKPYVIVKVAQSLDGMITTQKGKQGWITGPKTKAYVQDLRSQVDAVLVGGETVRIDDPQLNVRIKGCPQPKRVILDSELKLKTSAKVFHSAGGPVILVCGLPENDKRVQKFKKLGVSVLCIAPKNGIRPSLGLVLSRLRVMSIQSILVEGGAQIFESFLKSKWVDEWLFCVAPKIVGEAGLPAFQSPFKTGLKPQDIQTLGDDVLIQYQKK